MSAPCATYRRFNRTVIALAASAFALVATSNVVIDPYGVFGTSFLAYGAETNERVVKLRRLLRRGAPHDTLVFGSSVVGVVDPELLLPGHDAYNASFFAATPGHVLSLLIALDRGSRLPRHVVLAMDPFMFTAPPSHAPQVRLPPGASGESAPQFWRAYLFASSAPSMLAKAADALAPEPGVRFDFERGVYRLPWLDRLIEHDPAAYVRARLTSWPAAVPADAGGDRSAWAELQDLAQWVENRQDLLVTWVIPPVHRRTAHAMENTIANLRYALSGVSRGVVIDLSRHAVTSHDHHWYDHKHFRPASVARFVADLAPALHRATPGGL